MLGLVMSFSLILGPTVSMARCCCVANEVRQWIRLAAPEAGCCSQSAASSRLADAVGTDAASLEACSQSSCCQRTANFLSAVPSYQIDAGDSDCGCERQCVGDLAFENAALPPLAESIFDSHSLATSLPGWVFSLDRDAPAPIAGATSGLPVLSAQDRCVRLCRWLN
ncbi:MAG: hypothetical protein EA381_10330 [Planctomycetaceae bacterium]|nr:MAG: hypothetical protein EA381_10330 [Planctomycetaceae bacterium]